MVEVELQSHPQQRKMKEYLKVLRVTLRSDDHDLGAREKYQVRWDLIRSLVMQIWYVEKNPLFQLGAFVADQCQLVRLAHREVWVIVKGNWEGSPFQI